jgi:hypothetical protein
MQEALSNLAYAGEHGEFVRPATESKRSAISFEIAIVAFAILALVAAELMLSSAIRGTNFNGGDGKFAQAIILTAYKFGDFFHFNDINPLQGLGSQLLPINVWINPTYWPFALLDKAQAADAAAAIALGIFALACYVMARCFDVPILPSVIAAQLTIVLFAPILFLLQLSTVFTLMVGNAVVYAPHMIALGLLARLEPGSWRSFAVITAGIFGLLFYSLCCDPLWSTVSGLSWALPFAIVAFSRIRPKAVLIRCAALVCCVILLGVSRAAEYLFTLLQYTLRVQFPAVGDRVRFPGYEASVLFYSPNMKYFYLVWALGWLLGLLTLRGRARVLVVAGMVTCGALVAEIVVYLLLQNASWSFPLPVYAEQSLFALFLVSAVAGYGGALRAAALWARKASGWSAILHRPKGVKATSWAWLAKAASAFAVAAVLPAALVNYAINRPGYIAELYNEPWPNEPELAKFLTDNISQSVGRPFRGAVLFDYYTYYIHLTHDNLWIRSVPTIVQYGQLVTPQSTYFTAEVLKNDPRIMGPNGFMPFVSPYPEVFSRVLPMLGTRYFVVGNHIDPFHFIPLAYELGQSLASQSGSPVIELPQDARHPANVTSAARWYVYEVAHPNLGDYSPTIAMTAETGAAAAAMMFRPDFDFTKQVVLSTAIDQSLVPARNMQMSVIRNGLHVSGHSDGTSLVVLPQQFSHCLRARDGSVRLVRANFLVTGVIFFREIDTDIISDYGLFTPRCRWADIWDIKKLKMQIDALMIPLSAEGPISWVVRRPTLFPSWAESMATLGAAASALK